jgi:hypothetical protein
MLEKDAKDQLDPSCENEEVLDTVNKEGNIPRPIKRRKAKWIDYILCRNCLLQHVTEGNIEGRTDVTET